MLDTVRSWILAIVGTAVVCGAVKAITPEGGGKKGVVIICGFAMMAAVLSIAGDVDAMGIGMYMEQYSSEAQEYVREAKEESSRQTRFIIEQRCEAYILDKARSLGVQLSGVYVTARWSDEGFWYPESAVLEGAENEELAKALEGELGILRKNLRWSKKNEG